MTQKDYGAKNIKVLKGLEHVRRRPGMYTTTEDPTHIAQEVIDNVSDEILGGYATKCNVTIHADGSMSVEDDGRGIPIDIHPTEGIPAVEVIFTEMNSGGKFDNSDEDSAYKFSGGLHGVGVTVTNALSHKIEVLVKKDGEVFKIVFIEGIAVKNPETGTSVAKIGTCPVEERGTTVTFIPDSKYFDSPLFNLDKLRRLMKGKAILLDGSVFSLEVEESDDYKQQKHYWTFQGGAKAYLEEQMSKFDHTEVDQNEHYIENNEDYANYNKGEGIKWALCFSKLGSTHKESYVNLVPTKLGGTHVTGFERGIYEAVKMFADRNALLPKGVEIRREDVTNRASYILSASILEPSFQGQTKERLNNKEFAGLSELCIKNNFDNWLQINFETGKEIAEIAIESAQERMKAERKVVIRKTNSITSPLPDKLSDCTSKNPMEKEVFIVEGDSAGGSAKQARCKVTQAIMPLKGKPINAWDMDEAKVLSSEEIADVSTVMGVRPHKKTDDPKETLKDLRYNRIIVLADADIDGYHICVLFTGIILKHFPHIITEGHFAICQTPLYKIEVKSKGKLKGGKHYVQDDSEKEKLIANLLKKGFDESKISVSRFKGLGEMNPDQLAETALSPDTRELIIPKISVDELDGVIAGMDNLLSKRRIEERKAWIAKDGDFDKFDF